jgi:magnesium transporter
MELDQSSAIAMPSNAIALRENWSAQDREQKLRSFKSLERIEADDFFLSLTPSEQIELIMALPPVERRFWMHLLPPDDLTDLIQLAPPEVRSNLINTLDVPTQNEVNALLAYHEDEAGGLMNPRFARLRPEMRIDEALKYLRKQALKVETLRYAYVLDLEQNLLGVITLRHLFITEGDRIIKDVMRKAVLAVAETMSKEEITNFLRQSGLRVLPVIDELGRMKGIITLDDIIDVVEEEATEDIQKLGGMEVLDAPYLRIGLVKMIRKRAGWLVILFLGELFTATAMGYYESELERAIVLALFIPLIISSGGNSGSQASTLVVRAIALQEVRLRDWWRVFGRELVVGSALGLILGCLGFMRIYFWPAREELYGQHYALVGLAVGLSLVGIVLWGSLAGSTLPFILKKLKLDPAVASAPFVATLVDVSGLVIYFSVASLILRGALL